MRQFRSLLAFSLTLLLLVATAGSVSGAGSAPTSGSYAADSVIVQFKAGTPAVARTMILQNHGLSIKGAIFGTDVLVVQGRGKSVPDLVAALGLNPNVVYAEPDYIAMVDFVPNDPGWSNQWGPQKIADPQAWDVTQGSSGVMIGVVDTGVDLTHPDLAAKVRADLGYNFVNNTTSAQDDNGHGTHVAGIAAAITNNNTGVAGGCPGCSIVPVKVLDANGSGTYSAVASGIRYAADQGVKVINLSLGGSSRSRTLEDAVNYANGKGVLLACAAGNNNTSARNYPAYYTACVAVAATDQNDNKASFSTYGSWVDTSAPGVSIYSTYLNGTYQSLSGTSMATPHVAGLAGLLFSQGRTQTDVRTRLTSTTYTDPVNSTSIPPRINAYKAVSN